MNEHVPSSGPGVFYDGTDARQHPVIVQTAPDGLKIARADGTLLAHWPYDELVHLNAPADLLRLGRSGDALLARLEVRDHVLAEQIDILAGTVDRTGASGRRARKAAIVWAFAATVSLILVGIFGLPLLVERATPLIPLSVEQRLGAAVDPQVRSMLNTGSGGKPFECGSLSDERAGQAALDKLTARMQVAAGLPIPVKVVVLRREQANAIALPGGYIYVFNGLIDKMRQPDELAAVIAHEIGHVAHRDGTRSVLEAAGLSFLFGMVLGDFTGGGVVVIAARTIIQSAYSREVEAAADSFGVRLMARLGGDPRALGVALERIGGTVEPGSALLRDHPLTKDRIAAINASAASFQTDRRPLLDAAEWAALRSICG